MITSKAEKRVGLRLLNGSKRRRLLKWEVEGSEILDHVQWRFVVFPVLILRVHILMLV
jgi:hypothetical protein